MEAQVGKPNAGGNITGMHTGSPGRTVSVPKAAAVKSPTLTRNDCEVDSGGLPSSVTRMVMIFVVLACHGMGCQENTPLRGSMVAPNGASSRLKVSCCPLPYHPNAGRILVVGSYNPLARFDSAQFKVFDG